LIQVAITASTPALLAGLRHILSSADILVICESLRLEDLDACLEDIDVLVLGYEEDQEILQRFFDEMTFARAPAVLLLGLQDPAALDLFKSLFPVFGWLPLEATPGELAATVRALDEGLGVFHPNILNELLEQTYHESHPDRSRLNHDLREELTPRELQVLQLLAEGLANKQIAVNLGISENTIKFHVSSIFGKLGVNNRLEAVRAGVRQGLIIL
jgi:DNA-binding NarL/FixJ family response regulator